MIIVPISKQTECKTACSGHVPGGLIRFFGIVIVLGGVGLLTAMLFMLDRNSRSQSWSTTEGRVVESRIEERSGESKKYRPVIRYAYTVGGTAFESERYSFGSSRRSKKSAEGLCAKHPEGSAVQVHYDPARPAEAVLALERAGGAVLLGVIGALAMAAGAFVFTLSFRGLNAAVIPSTASV